MSQNTSSDLDEAVVLAERARVAFANDDIETTRAAMWKLWAMASKVFTDLGTVDATDTGTTQ